MFETNKKYPPLYKGQYFNHPIVYDGRNFILTLVKKGKPGETCVILNNGWTIKDPFSKPVEDDFPNAWIFGLYYKLSNPMKSSPKRLRVKLLLRRHPELFGCEGLYDAGKELEQFVKEQMASKEVLLVGFTKSANMLLNGVEYPSNVTIDAICPMFGGTLTTMPEIMKKYLKFIYCIVGRILTEHIVDDDISVGSPYVTKADYSKVKFEQVTVVISSFDKNVPHTWKDVRKPGNLFFLLASPIMEKAIRENHPDKSGYKSNGFLSYGTQTPPFAVSKKITVWGSMPMTLKHPEVKKLINQQIKEKNKRSFKQ